MARPQTGKATALPPEQMLDVAALRELLAKKW
ncbi:MAG: hypothetical protein FD152_755 [Xanthobacteraceae bacterium]|nr:MAG: hypothetical protein FD152_755 [Xanthobacteraceae bacterium]